MNKIDFRQVVTALSDALDLVGIDDVQHGKRVAFMATECGRQLGMVPDQLDHLYHAALLHDCGVSSTIVHRNLVSELEWSGTESHCLRGHDLLAGLEVFADLAPTIRYHHTHWDELETLGLPAELTRLTNCIYLTDRVDMLVAQAGTANLLLAKDEIRRTIAKFRGHNFSPELLDAFMRISDSEYFWLTLQPNHLNLYLADMAMDSKPKLLSHAELLGIAKMFAAIVDAKSPFTAEHSLGVANLAGYLATRMGLPMETCREIEIAGLLHDLGKLVVPDEILEKNGPLDDQERAAMKRHSFETFQILRRIEGFDGIVQMAAFHHETLAGDGYPFHIKDVGLTTEARIVAVADIFQALAQNRPYRASMPLQDLLPILTAMADTGKLDREVVATVLANPTGCWQAATGSPGESPT